MKKKTKKIAKDGGHFIATKYKNEPVQVSYYTKDWQYLSTDQNKKTFTKEVLNSSMARVTK